jgi:hypothetical protein
MKDETCEMAHLAAVIAAYRDLCTSTRVAVTMN